MATEEHDAGFQEGARMADIGVTMIMARAQEGGATPRAVAAGALMALVRYHVNYLNIRLLERDIVKIMMPAIAKCIRSLQATAADDGPAPPRQH